MLLSFVDPFSYRLFWTSPTSSLAFLFLIFAFISLWIRRRPYFWGPLLAISYFFAVRAKVASLETLIPLLFLLIAHLILHGKISGIKRLIAVLLTTALSLALSFHLVPGFNNWLILSKMHLSPDALPYMLKYNFDKPFIGFFILALNLPLIEKAVDWKRMFIFSLPLTLVAVGILLFLNLQFRIVQYDFKVAPFLPIWISANLFLTTIPEEAFFRGFLQRELTSSIKTFWSPFFSIFAISLCFALIHIAFIDNFSYIVLVFIASVIYGSIYQITQRIESSIFCHFALNLVHILFFTYPALSSIMKAKT